MSSAVSPPLSLSSPPKSMKRTIFYLFLSAGIFYGGFSVIVGQRIRDKPLASSQSTRKSSQSSFSILESLSVPFRGFNRTKQSGLKRYHCSVFILDNFLEPRHNITHFSSAGGCGLESIEWQWCSETASKFNFSPLTEMDSKLPENLRPNWRKKNCDNLFKHRAICEQPVPHCPVQHYESSLAASLLNSEGSDSLNVKKVPLIAVLAGTTTRRVTEPHTDKIALFTLLLPSLIRSIDCGFRYVYVMGYDQGDPFYDSENGMNEVLSWWAEQIEKPMKRNGIMITLEPVKIVNHLRKPGPVFIEMARRAYTMGADYIYRVNDDTEFRGHWPKLYVRGLQILGPPYGVIGPSSIGSNDNILTHDFVHRIHMDIFEMNYYPLELVDWWMDNWISCVYGSKRTYISKASAVVHHTYAHGQRYEVDRSNERHLSPS